MNQSNDRIKFLLTRYQQKKCTHEEFQELFEWIHDRFDDEDLLNFMDKSFEVTNSGFNSEHIDWDTMFANISTDTSKKHLEKLNWNRKKTTLLAVCFLLIALTISFYSSNIERMIPVESQQTKTTFLPAENIATLKLEDGSQILLNAGEQTIKTKDFIIKKSKDEVLNYQIQNISVSESPSIHTLTVPRQGKYNLQLSDGTLVWLNAGSSITYPTRFQGKTRDVFIIGEAYFEVAKKPNHPFLVSGDKFKVEVLGTHFNIKAYEQDLNAQITLLEGSVKVSGANHEKQLTPGQQITVDSSGELLKIEAVDPDPIIAWRHSTFFFNNTPVNQAVSEMERWYNVEISYKTDKENLTFTGMISRNQTLEEVLELLKSSSNVSFQVRKNQIYPVLTKKLSTYSF